MLVNGKHNKLNITHCYSQDSQQVFDSSLTISGYKGSYHYNNLELLVTLISQFSCNWLYIGVSKDGVTLQSDPSGQLLVFSWDS